MTDNKLTDEQIIKVFDNCFNRGFSELECDKCPFYTATTKCTEDLRQEVINLINRQKAEIERLNKEVDRLTQAVMHNDAITEMLISEARKEFAKRSKKKATYYRCRDGIKYAVSISDIDNLLKEMDGESE